MNINKRQIANIRHQSGAVLIVSLMIMLVMTIIGISALSGTTLEEKMAHNYQQSMIVFQGAETAIEKIIIAGDPGGAGIYDNPFYDVDQDPLVTSLSAGLNDTSTVVAYDETVMDPNNYVANAKLTTSSTVSFKGTNACPETSFEELICMVFDVTAAAGIAETDTNDTHVQTIERPAPGGAS